MEEYHKINAPFKRNNDGDKKLIIGDWALDEFEYLATNTWEFTEKVDGTNIRVRLRAIDDGVVAEYGGRTNNAQIPPHLILHLEKTFPNFPLWRRDLEQPAYYERHKELGVWMKDNGLQEVLLHGEGYGPMIQGGGKYREDASFVLFDVKIGDSWLTRDNVDDIAEKLGIDSVPILGYGTISDAIAVVKGDTRRRVELWDEEEQVFQKQYVPGRLKSTWGDFEAEGIVARPLVPLFDRQGKRIITKIKGRDFNNASA